MKRIIYLLVMVCLMLTGLSVRAQDEGLITKPITVMGGSLLQQISQTKKDLITDLKVTGCLSEEEMSFVCSMKNLKYLDLSEIQSGRLCLKRCYSLESVKLPGVGNSIWDDVIMYDSCFFECQNLKSVSFLVLVRRRIELSRCAFMGCHSLEKIIFSDECWVGFVGEECFSGCKKLESLAIPFDGYFYSDVELEMFRKGTFNGCEGLRELNIHGPYGGSGNIYICSDDFKDCANLETIRIDSIGVVRMEAGAFSNHLKLRELYIDCWNVFRSHKVFCEKNSFENCMNLRSIHIRCGGEVRISNRAFAGCTSLESVSLDCGTGKVEGEAFVGCTSLNTISFGLDGSFPALEDYAFAGCNDFTLFLTSAMPPTINANAFDQLSSNCTLYVPNGTRDDYWLSPWGDIFANIKEYDATDVKGVVAGGKSVIGTYSLDGTVFKVGGKGVVVERDANGKTRKVLRK